MSLTSIGTSLEGCPPYMQTKRFFSSGDVATYTFATCDDLAEVGPMVQTVQGYERLYTKRQVRDAERARDLREELGFVSTQNLVKMVKHGIPGCDVTAADV